MKSKLDDVQFELKSKELKLFKVRDEYHEKSKIGNYNKKNLKNEMLKLKIEKEGKEDNLNDLEEELKQNQKYGFETKKIKLEISKEEEAVEMLKEELEEKQNKLKKIEKQQKVECKYILEELTDLDKEVLALKNECKEMKNDIQIEEYEIKQKEDEIEYEIEEYTQRIKQVEQKLGSKNKVDIVSEIQGMNKKMLAIQLSVKQNDIDR